MNKFIFISAFTLAIIISCKNSNTVDDKYIEVSIGNFNKIDSLLGKYLQEQVIQGALALLARDGEILYHKAHGYANMEEERLQQNSDIFRLASMTKQITSVAAMILYDQGKFSLDDPLGKYIPEYAEMEVADGFNLTDSSYTGHPAEKEITIRQLFTHSSGIGYGFQDERLMALIAKAGITEGFEQRNILLKDNITRLAEIPLMHEPGLRFTYGLNTDVLGRLVEIWSGQLLDTFIHEYIFEPLGMTDTWFYLPEEQQTRLVDVYMSAENGIALSPEPYLYPVEGAKTYLSGGADLSSTAYDYYLFAQMMLNGGELNGVRILKPKTARLMTQTHLETGDYDMGLGFSVLSEKTITTDSRTEGSYSGGGYFGTTYWIDPKEKLIAILMLQIYPFENKGMYKNFEDEVYNGLRRPK